MVYIRLEETPVPPITRCPTKFFLAHFCGQSQSGERTASGASLPRRRCRSRSCTRKSLEEGLEQAVNSLDAQREACEAYIRSQAHEGWQLVDAQYDDGGFSGGNIERPALKRLMGEVKRGHIDIIVVYKVDLQTRDAGHGQAH
jgi:hypothetical protein